MHFSRVRQPREGKGKEPLRKAETGSLTAHLKAWTRAVNRRKPEGGIALEIERGRKREEVKRELNVAQL